LFSSALAFAIQIDKEVMEVIGASIEAVGDYDKVCLCTIIKNEAKFCINFWSELKVSS
jgi:hypothetical protein